MKGFNLSALAVREKSITLFLIIAVALSGTYAFLKLGRAEDPAFTIKVLTVTTVWPGATAQEMQNLVAEPLEKRLQELRWYDRVTTITRPGMALMTLILKSSMPPKELGEQFYQARKKLSDETIKLPKGVIGPFVNDEYSDVTFALYALKAPDLPMRKLSRKAESIRQEMLHVPGVKKVNILGEQPERIFVEFSYAHLTNLGVSPAAIFSALRNENRLTPAGSIETDGPRVYVRLDGAYDELEDIGNTAISANGRTFKLKDVATVKRGYEDPTRFTIRHDGQPAIVLGVIMREGWNGLDLGENLTAEADRIRDELPIGIDFKKITDQAVNIDHAVSEFMVKFIAAITVVMLVSLVSMGWRVGMVVVAAVPLTLAIVFVLMLVTDRVFDRITLGALILALGLLVDDAIIAIETMVIKMEEGMDRVKAAAYSWSHTAAPMLSGTIVTVIGFMPVGFARSTAGEYAGNIFWVVGFALIASWFVAVIFTPFMGVKMLPNISKVNGGHDGIYSTPNYQKLRSLITWAVRRKFTVAAVVFTLFMFAGVGMAFIQQQFFPNSDRPEVLIELQLQEGSAIGLTDKATKKVEDWLRQQPESEVVTAYVGQGAPRFFFSYNPELPDPAFAKIVVLTPNPEARDQLMDRLRAAVQNGLAPEAQTRVSQLVFGPYTPYPVEFRVMGPDTSELRNIADQVADVLRNQDNMRSVNHDWSERQPKVNFVINHERLRQLGMSSAQVSEQLQFLISGITVTTMRENIRNVSVVARSSGNERFDPSLFQDFNLVNASGKIIPLSQVGKIEFSPEDPVLKRRNRIPTITVRGDVAKGMQPNKVSKQVFKALLPIINNLPKGYSIEQGGIIEQSLLANKALLPIFPIMILLTLMVIIFQVRSLSAMTMVYLTAPLGLIGAVPALLLFNQPFGFNAILGLIGLSGILMRNTLILIQQIKDNLDLGLSQYDAVIEATVQRARPVILTALAAVLAFMPLTQSSFWGSMAYTLIGGTAVGTILTLVFLPALYSIWFKVSAEDKGEVK